MGVQAALDGKTAQMCALTRVSDEPYRVEPALLDVREVANKVKPVPRSWISPDGMGITCEFRRYVAPLAGALPAQLPPLKD